MKAYAVRWENGEVSIAFAKNKDDAICILDEFGNAEDQEMWKIKEPFCLDFSLDNDGHLELGQVSEQFQNDLMERAFPLLEKGLMEGPDDMDVAPLVEQERKRLWGKPIRRREKTNPIDMPEVLYKRIKGSAGK